MPIFANKEAGDVIARTTYYRSVARQEPLFRMPAGSAPPEDRDLLLKREQLA